MRTAQLPIKIQKLQLDLRNLNVGFKCGEGGMVEEGRRGNSFSFHFGLFLVLYNN